MKLLGFKITINTNFKITIFLDVTLNIEKGTFEPFKNENDIPIHIHTFSNHPPSIIKQIPMSIRRRLSGSSSNIDVFKSKKNIYNNALKSGYAQLEWIPLKTKPNNRKKKHNLVDPTL